MSEMTRDFFERSPFLILPIFALAIFTIAFVLIALRALFAKRNYIETVSNLPLREDEADGI